MVLVIVAVSLLVVGLIAVATAALHPSASPNDALVRQDQPSNAYVITSTTLREDSAIVAPAAPDLSSPADGSPPDNQGVPQGYAPSPSPAPVSFDAERAMEHIRRLADDIGVRASGTAGESAAIEYVVEYLAGLGYEPRTPVVALPGGATSRNVVVIRPGNSSDNLVVGAHLDSKAPAPGANDNASGVATVLELARSLHDTRTEATLTFVLFGAEETVDANEDHHHYGSRDYVRTMTAQQRAELRGMISVDMVAYGGSFVVRTMGKGPSALADMIAQYAAAHSGTPLAYLTDRGPSGWSDHEAFELAGYPVAWVEWRTDPAYHGTDDVPDHCRPALVEETGKLLDGFLRGLDSADLETLRGAYSR